MYEVFESENNVHLVLEILSGGELFERIKSHGNFDEPDAAIIMRGIFTGLVSLHSKGIVHRDLKPENIIFKYSHSLKN